MDTILNISPMSIKEARKILGVDYASFNDDAIKKLVCKLDNFAGLIVKYEKVLNSIDLSRSQDEKGSK